MILFALKLLIAHVLGDFVFQPDRWVKSKKKKKFRSKHLYYHIGIHLLSLLVLLRFDMKYWLGILIIIISHYFIDILKLNYQKKKNLRVLFVIDQLFHILIIALVVYYYHHYSIDFSYIYTEKVLGLILSILCLTSVSSILIRVVMSRWYVVDYNEKSLDKAGKYIGILERIFVFVFVITNQWAAIGFLITAKSVFRFGDLSKSKNLQLTEYVLIGTLLSFGLAIITGIAYLEFIK